MESIWECADFVNVGLTFEHNAQYVVNGTVLPGWNEGQVTLQSGQYRPSALIRE